MGDSGGVAHKIIAEAESRSLTNYVETALLLDLARREEAERVITMYAVPGTSASIRPEDVVRARGESDEDYAERQVLAVELWSIPDNTRYGMIEPGSFVRVLFPTREQPHVPGLLYIGYMLIVAKREAIAAWMTSQPWPAGTPPSTGTRVFDAEAAERLNRSRAFMLRLDVLAKPPLTREWFPDMERSGRGIVAVAPASLQEESTRVAANLVRRRREMRDIRCP